MAVADSQRCSRPVRAAFHIMLSLITGLQSMWFPTSTRSRRLSSSATIGFQEAKTSLAPVGDWRAPAAFTSSSAAVRERGWYAAERSSKTLCRSSGRDSKAATNLSCSFVMTVSSGALSEGMRD